MFASNLCDSESTLSSMSNCQLSKIQVNQKYDQQFVSVERFEQSFELQHKYQNASIEERESIFQRDIQPQIEDFINDRYFHYVIQCVLTIGEKEHQDIIWGFVEENMGTFWNKKYLYKTLLLAVQEKPQNSILNFINQNFDEFKVDRYGNLLISALLEWIEDVPQLNEFIQKLDLKKIQDHQHGCLIVIKLLDLINHKDPEVRAEITIVLNSLISQSIQLAQNQFGNYIIQKILELNLLGEKQRLLDDFLIPKFMVLSRDKYGSNVCEKMLYVCMEQQLQTIWSKTIKMELRFFLNDPFSNYVMQHFYYYACRFPKIQVQFSQQILSLYRHMKLNQNGKMVYRFIYNNNNDY